MEISIKIFIHFPLRTLIIPTVRKAFVYTSFPHHARAYLFYSPFLVPLKLLNGKWYKTELNVKTIRKFTISEIPSILILESGGILTHNIACSAYIYFFPPGEVSAAWTIKSNFTPAETRAWNGLLNIDSARRNNRSVRQRIANALSIITFRRRPIFLFKTNIEKRCLTRKRKSLNIYYAIWWVFFLKD